MRYKILILKNNNPLSQHLCSMSDEKIEFVGKSFAMVKGTLRNYQIIISMSNYSAKNPFDLSPLDIVFKENYKRLPNTKFIFMSWFNISDHFQYYTQYITPASNELLNEENCCILNLPVTREKVFEKINSFLKK